MSAFFVVCGLPFSLTAHLTTGCLVAFNDDAPLLLLPSLTDWNEAA